MGRAINEGDGSRAGQPLGGVCSVGGVFLGPVGR